MENKRVVAYINRVLKDAEEKFHCRLNYAFFFVDGCCVMSIRGNKKAVSSVGYRLSRNLFREYGFTYSLLGSKIYSEGFSIDSIKSGIPLRKIDRCVGIIRDMFGEDWVLYAGTEHRSLLNENYGVFVDKGFSYNQDYVAKKLDIQDKEKLINYEDYSSIYKEKYSKGLLEVTKSGYGNCYVAS